jgi:hypothetical protein
MESTALEIIPSFCLQMRGLVDIFSIIIAPCLYHNLCVKSSSHVRRVVLCKERKGLSLQAEKAATFSGA